MIKIYVYLVKLTGLISSRKVTHAQLTYGLCWSLYLVPPRAVNLNDNTSDRCIQNSTRYSNNNTNAVTHRGVTAGLDLAATINMLAEGKNSQTTSSISVLEMETARTVP